MTPKQLSYRLGRLPAMLPVWLNESMESVKEEIVDRNVEQMEGLGQDSTGRSFGDYEDSAYKEQKALLGLESRFINLHFDGDFHSKMQIEIDNGGVNIWSSDEKNDVLVARYGSDIFGLNDSNFDWLFDEVFDYLETRIRSYFT